jgi:hypothetical protein
MQGSSQLDRQLGRASAEMNPLAPLWYHDQLSKIPAGKGVPVRIVAE